MADIRRDMAASFCAVGKPMLRCVRCALWLGSCQLLLVSVPAFARGARDFEVGFQGFYGIANLDSSSVSRMNERLGNSPRLSHPYKFARQPVYGGWLSLWTSKKRFVFGLGGWQSSMSLRAKPNFDDVSGAASLGLAGFAGSAGMRLLPWSDKTSTRRAQWWTRFRGYGSVTVGVSELDLGMRVLDSDRVTDVSYRYASSMGSLGTRLHFAFDLTRWLFINFELNTAFMQAISSSLAVEKYTVGGRDETVLAKDQLLKEFGQPLLLTSMVLGCELFL